jgi:hypothetical protein
MLHTTDDHEHFPFLNSMPLKISAANRQRAARIKLFLCDVDGVLTDGKTRLHLLCPGNTANFFYANMAFRPHPA